MEDLLKYVKAIITDQFPDLVVKEGKELLKFNIEEVGLCIHQEVSTVPSLVLGLDRFSNLFVYEILFNELSDLEFLIPNYIKVIKRIIATNLNQFRNIENLSRSSAEIEREFPHFLELDLHRYPRVNGDIIKMVLTFAELEDIIGSAFLAKDAEQLQ